MKLGVARHFGHLRGLKRKARPKESRGENFHCNEDFFFFFFSIFSMKEVKLEGGGILLTLIKKFELFEQE